MSSNGDAIRPSSAALQKAFAEVARDPLLSAASVRSKAKSGAIGLPTEANLRSLYWKLYLNVLSPSTAIWPDTLKRHRRQWTDLTHDYLRAPDGTWVEGAQPQRSSSTQGASAKTDATFDPLGNEQQNPWLSWYKDLELRKIVRQDVDRTFPDNEYFRMPRVQDSMTNILFVFAKLHSDVGYRQGMHEILAIVLWCTDLDSLDGPSSGTDVDNLAHLVLSRQHIEHDAYALFNVLLTSMLSWYDPAMSVPAGPSSGQLPASTTGMVQPIVAKCARIHDLLKKVDHELWRRMEELKIEPQIYGIKWLRLLFSREFPMEEALKLWDALFAEDLYPTLHLVDYVCLAMLLRIRESLLDADYSTFLQGLLRYPMPGDADPRVLLLVQQAAYLRDNTTNFGGAYVRRQNQQLGAEAGAKSGTRAEEALYERRSNTPLSPGSTIRQQGASATAFIDQGRNIAEGLYAKSEALGINKALWTGFGELKKSVQAYQAQQQGNGFSEIPSRSSWEAEPAKNYALDLKKLKVENQAMGNALSASLQVLEAQLRIGPGSDPSTNTALSTMHHIRDVLMGQRSHFNPASVVPLLQAATGNLLDERIPPNASSSSSQIQPTKSLMDDTSPSMSSTSTFPPLKQPVFSYPVAPPRTIQPGHLKSASVVERPVDPPLPQLPAHSHQRSGSTSSTKAPIPDLLGDWQSPSMSSDTGFPPSSSFPRMPPASRATNNYDGSRTHPNKMPSPLTTQGTWKSHNDRDPDPLGVLF